MRLLLLVVCVLVIFAVPVLAVDPPVDNGVGVLGIYTQPAAGPGSDTHLENVVPGEVYRLYFVLYHDNTYTRALGAYEFGWRVEPAGAAPMVLDIQWAPQYGECYNFGSAFDLLVGYTMWNPHDPAAGYLLFSADVMFDTAPDNAGIYLGPSSLESIAGEMAYCDFVRPDELFVMVPNNQDQSQDAPVFTFNSVVATEARSLSSVKALFD
ncbi:MAG: hypothetical protein R3D98_07130 [Candidatus Krumholzibacteriia bacterium]